MPDPDVERTALEDLRACDRWCLVCLEVYAAACGVRCPTCQSVRTAAMA